MLKDEEIYAIYNLYKKDLKPSIMPQKIEIIFESVGDTLARVGRILPDFFELYLNKEIFCQGDYYKEYLTQILYHEFSHVQDRFLYLKHIQNERQHGMFLFPFTEFQASKIEMMKALDLFSSPSKPISFNTPIYTRYGIASVKDYLDIEQKVFVQMSDELKDIHSLDKIKSIIYLLIYNIGHISVLKRYGINGELRYEELYSFISYEINKLKQLLLNEKPSDLLCLQSYGYTFNLTEKIKRKFISN
jgi:hypothetical protein